MDEGVDAKFAAVTLLPVVTLFMFWGAVGGVPLWLSAITLSSSELVSASEKGQRRCGWGMSKIKEAFVSNYEMEEEERKLNQPNAYNCE